MEVWVDHREKRAEVWRYLEQTDDVTVSYKSLAVGDYVVPDTCVVERKTFTDFAQSVKNGRIFEQATRLAHCGFPSMLVLEGTTRDIRSMRMKRTAVQGALITLTVIYKLPLLRSLRPDETARLINLAARQIRDRGKPYYYRKKHRSSNKRKQQFMLLQSLPGVGADRARKLLDSFDTVEDIMMAELEDLAEVDGIGFKTAEQIKNIVRDSRSEFDYSWNE